MKYLVLLLIFLCGISYGIKNIFLNNNSHLYYNEMTTEYDFKNMIRDNVNGTNKNKLIIDKILVEKKENYIIIISNKSDCEKSDDIYYHMMNIITKLIYYNYDGCQKVYKIETESGRGYRFISGLEKMINHSIKYEYFVQPESFFGMIKTYAEIIIEIIVKLIIFGIIQIVVSFMRLISKSDDKEDNGITNLLVGNMDVIIKAETDVNTKFTDIAGIEEAKLQMQVYVDIMKNRNKYEMMGARIPKGVLLCGPPGCGKTLLAKAVAGEAGVKFIATTGSDFDELFVGVGSSRVKKLFKMAREEIPCIIFIDEIDSIGTKRHDKNTRNRESETINKILAEMDGFKKNDNILVIASTNREDILDPALLRSGRFDSKIYIEPPNKKERIEIFKIYLNKIKLDTETNVGDLAKSLADMTPGMTGADISNICNQAAIQAVAKGADVVKNIHLINAIDDIGIGIEKKTHKTINNELEIVAYHESGHALIGYLLPNGNSPVKISIVPRGKGNLGYTQHTDYETRILTKEQYIAEIYCLLGGRAAEIVKFNKITSGASDDLKKATNIMYNMVTKLGMYDMVTKMKVYESPSPMVYELNETSNTHISDSGRYQVEKFVESNLEKMMNETMAIITQRSEELEILAKHLLQHEYLDIETMRKLLPNTENSLLV